MEKYNNILRLVCLILVHVALTLGFTGGSSSMNSIDKALYRSYFGCPDCDPALCTPPRPPAGAQECELVPESGICSCCDTCARTEGEACGPYSERCGDGLSCQPPPTSADPMRDLFQGRGVCAKIQEMQKNLLLPGSYLSTGKRSLGRLFGEHYNQHWK